MQELFAVHAQEDLDAIEEAAAVGDGDVLAKRAHRLKGGSYSFGAERLGDTAAEVERMAKAGNLDVGPQVAELVVLFRATKAHLDGETETASKEAM